MIPKELNFHPAIITYLRRHIGLACVVANYSVTDYYITENINEKYCDGGCPEVTDKKYIDILGNIYDMCAICHMMYSLDECN
jgi:hypothetical protein